MLDERQVLAALDRERRELKRSGEVLDLRPAVTRLRAADNSHHVVIYASLTAETADSVIEEQVEHYGRLGVDFEWKVYAHDAPSDVLDRLARRGFAVGPAEAVMVRECNASAGDLPSGVSTVSRIERTEQIDDYRYVAEEVFGKRYDFTSAALTLALHTGNQEHRGYVASCDGRPVSIGRLYTHPDSLFGGLYGGATLPSHRGRGFYRAVVAARARDAIELGARYLLVDALPTSRPILERMGFRRITDTWPCEWKNSESVTWQS